MIASAKTCDRIRQALIRVAAAGLFVCTGCATTGTAPSGESEVPRTQLILLNTQEASAWVAYLPGNPEAGEQVDYRIQVSRMDNNEVVYESIMLLPTDIGTHAFELAPNDPLLRSAYETIDRDVLTRIEEHGDTAEEEAASRGPVQLRTIEAGEDYMILDQGDARALQIGQRFYLRTPPTYGTNPVSGEQIILSGSRVAGLLEIVEVNESRATLSLLSGSMSSAGYLELVK